MSKAQELIALTGIALALIVFGIWIAVQVKERSPERRERKRRLFLNQRGRLGDALITEASESIIYYVYSVHGVQYTASQDVSALRDRLPADPQKLIGAASMKYAVRNPANSILLCEEWSGLRVTEAGPGGPARTRASVPQPESAQQGVSGDTGARAAS